MDPNGLPDSTDWLTTPLAAFSQLENALHCQICKEFYDTPMITSCSHTFCSRCIRTSLSSDGKCPACRTPDQASKLRNNWALQEVVGMFVAARPAAISVARKEREQEQEEVVVARSKRPGKRKRAVLDSDDVDVDVGERERDGRVTRSKSRKTAASQTSHPDATQIEDSDDEENEAYSPERLPEDGLVECPLGCGKRMKIESVDPHLDRCEDEQKQARKRAKSRPPVHTHGFGITDPPSQRQNARPQDRLNELNYSLLREQPMRKKLDELGISSTGPKQLMIKRHVEWVNLWNANCDSSRPRSKRELLEDLRVWERTQGGGAPNTSASGVMRKDFDGARWGERNRGDFARLIEDARRKKPVVVLSSSPLNRADSEDPAKAALEGEEGSRPPHFDVQVTEPSVPLPPELTIPETSQPYADDPDAMASVREKVAAANAGEHVEPVMNDGFPSQQPPETSSPNGLHAPSQHHDPTDPSHLAPPGSENKALLTQARFGSSSSHDEHSPGGGRAGTPCELPAHLRDAAPRKVPMFAVPSLPVEDAEMTVQ